MKLRKEKGAQVMELKRLNEDANSNIESLTRSEQLLRKRLEEAQSKTEESLTKVQQLQEAAARAEESFRQELESSRRLVELKDQQSQTHRDRLKEVELRLEQVKDDGAAEVRRIRQELEQERQGHQEMTQRFQELETETDRLRAMLESQETDAAPQTPRPNGQLLGRPGSPFGTPGSIRGKSFVRATEALDELYTVKGQLAGEKRRAKKLQEDLDDAVTMLEAKLPEIDELTAETERLRNEAIHMSEIMQQCYEDRDASIKAARKAESTASTAQAEVKIMRSQLRDLSTQIHVLIFNIHAREKGLDQLTEEEAEQFERLQRGEVAENALEDMSDTHQFITQKFVAFKDIVELQEKNQELLRVTRELADKMENEEAIAAKQQAAQDHQDVEELRNTVSALQDEVRSLTVRMKSYMTERDMFRRMLQQKANPAEIHATLGIPMESGQRSVLASIEQNSQEEADLTAALRELQGQFDSYRNDQATERNALKEQVERLSAEKSSLQSEVARVSSQLALATERYNMLDSNFKAVQREKQELQNRNQTLHEENAKFDVRTQQAAENLIEQTGLVESLRTENANLKAEKHLWKSIQDRLSKDNESLAEEKSRLNGLLTNQQSLLNERELSESETKRRLQGQIDTLETELSTTKRKLAEEVEESKKTQLRKEFDGQQYQKRIDELTTTISQIKEENVALKTTRDHLQARVGELEIEIKNAQERADRLRPILTSRSQAAGSGESNAEALARIEELENEIAELKNALELANAQAENAKQQCENFKQLGQELEQELTSLGEVQEQYRQEMDAALGGKDSTINELKQRVEALTTELGSTTSELNLLRDSQADVSRKFEEKERMLNSEITRLKDEEERYKETAKFHQQDLRAQAEIATKAQQEYEQELLKHAEAAKLLQQIRVEHNELKTQSASLKAEAESAKLSLTQSEQSWEERRQQLEQEIGELKARRDDADAQNKILHQQLDSLSTQIAGLQKSRAETNGDTDLSTTTGAPASSDSAGLLELNKYLRREKEILEVQYDLKVKEANRLQQQLEYSQSQLDEARLKLEQERSSQADSARNSLSHKELMDKLNELNLIRESNVTLRNESQRTQAQLEQKIAFCAELEAKIQPLEARISELELDKTFKEAEIKQLQESRDGLQKRMEAILSKYGQADPQEVEQLKATIASLEAERDSLKESEQALQTKLQETEAEITALQTKVQDAETAFENERVRWAEGKQRMIDDFKARMRNAKTAREEALAEKIEAQALSASANERLAAVEQELEVAKLELSKQREQQATATASNTQPTPSTEAPQAASGQVAVQDPELVQQLENLQQELESVKAEKAAVVLQLEQLRLDYATAISERDEARATAAERQTTALPGGQTTTTITTPGLSDEERKALEEKIAQAEARIAELEADVQEKEDKFDSIVKVRSDKMKASLNKLLANDKEANAKKLQEDREALQKEFDLKLQQEIAILKAEQQTAAPAPQNGVPSTPAKPGPVDLITQTPSAGTPGGVADVSALNNMTDAQIRELIKTNPTLKSIITANVKKLAEMDTKKAVTKTQAELKTEYEAKIASAKEQAAALSEKKSALRINMLDRQSKTAQAKIAVVETAAKETPQRPVGEVWEIAKDAKPPASAPAPAPTPAAAAPTPAPAAVPAASTGKFKPRSPRRPCPNADPHQEAPVVTPTATTEDAKPQVPGIPAPTVSAKPNPFAQSATGANPFGAPANTAAPAQAQSAQAQGQQPARTGIPVPRGGAAGGRGGRGGTYQAPGRGGQRGRGGFGGRGGAQGGLNPGAGEFNPAGAGGAGNKRPREDAGQNTGAKRPRGGGGSTQ
ncbi:hypothetical protein OQA88_10191 [Cercophora sp. LCS_1]